LGYFVKTARIGLLIGLFILQPAFSQAQETAPQVLSLTLSDAVRIALSPKGNVAIDVASQSITYAEAHLREVRTASHPDIDFSFTGQNQVISLYAQGLQSVQLPGYIFPKTAGPFSVLDARVHIRQSLIDPASARRADAARAGIDTATAETDEIRDRIAARVALLYVSAQRSAGAVDAAQAMVASAEATLKEVTDRKAEDKALAIDVSHARLVLASEKQRLMQAQLELARVEIELLSALNRDLNTPLDLTEPLTFTAQDTPSVVQALATALKSRSDIVIQRKRAAALHLDDAAIEAERLPSLTGYADTGSIGTSIPNSTGTYDVGLSLRIPIIDGGRRESRRSELQVSIHQEELRTSEIVNQVELEVRQALLKLDIARGNFETSKVGAEVAEEELEHRRRRYEEGAGSRQEVTDAQTGLVKANDDRVAALCAWNQARIELMRAMGTIRTLAQ
jgi:outer membrane protein